jgi:glutathione S-transferase
MTKTTGLILWGAGTSRTIRPHWALHELSLRYESRAIGPRTGETKTAEYTALSPRQKIPLLQDGVLTIGESAAIIAYLARKYSSAHNQLIPCDPTEYAKWLEWCFFIATELDSTSLYVMRRHGANGLAHIYGLAPEVVAAAAEYFRGQLRFAESALRDGRQYLCGSQFTTADILFVTCLDWAIGYGVDIGDTAKPYLARIQRRPAYQLAKKANLPLNPGESVVRQIG